MRMRIASGFQLKKRQGLDELVDLIKKKIFEQYITCKLLVPFDRGDVVSYLNDKANVKKTEYEEEGTLMTVEMDGSERVSLRSSLSVIKHIKRKNRTA